MENNERYVAQGSVRFKVAGKMPQWPLQCVVCGAYCAETEELWSKALEPNGGRGERVVHGDLRFAIPLHVSGDVCYPKFLWPIPYRVLLAGALLSVAFGGIMLALIRPVPDNRWAIFAIFTILAAVAATVTVKVRFPPYLAIWQKDASEYTASFRDASQAQKFAELNRDIVMPWNHPAWLDPFLKWR